ncbi:MAG TPA: sensor domain-containing diguanylate cyclase [Vicinamibacteria bacterium]|nr:sensor domain-containing diguanylate cyclase [Vicinamibacteria bacterium]
MAEGAPPFFDVRARWRAGRIALIVAGLVGAVALLRPLERGLGPGWLRLAIVLVLGIGLSATAFLASLRGRGPLEQVSFYAFLFLSLDALAQTLAPYGLPGWPLVTLLLAGVAIAERLPLAAALGALAAAMALADAGWRGAWRGGAAAACGYLILVFAVNRALLGEKRRLSRATDELARLKYGIGQLEEDEGRRGRGGAGALRQVSEDARRARQADGAAELDGAIRKLVCLARLATSAHAVLYFELDRQRDVAFIRAADAPDSLVLDATPPLGEDPFAFVLERRATFYATDFKRLLWSLPWYRSQVKIGSLIAVPVRAGDVVVAVIVADGVETQAFTGHEPDVLAAFADLAADAVLRARMLQSREDATAAFEAAQDLSRRLASQSQAANVYRLLLGCAQQVAAPEMAAVVIADELPSRYAVKLAEGWAQEYVGREVALDERTWAAWVVRSAEEPQLLGSVADDKERMPLLVLDEGPGRAESLLAVPLRERSRNVGALLLAGKRGSFSVVTGHVLQMIANQAAAVLGTIRLIERHKEVAVRDGLTGLYNRRAFQDLLNRTVARQGRQGGSFGLVLLDIDHFKKLNDTHGHPAGDEALKQVAAVLREHSRAGDEAARYGGEEFAVVLASGEPGAAMQTAERLRKEVQAAVVRFAGGSIRLTASFGVAVWPRDGETPEALLAAVDRALYAAKQGGRNRVVEAAPTDAPSR